MGRELTGGGATRRRRGIAFEWPTIAVAAAVYLGFGLLTWLVAGAASVYAVYLKYWENTTFIQTPLPLIAIISFNTGVMSILMGFLAELLMRTYFESQHKAPYAVKQSINVEVDA